MTEVGRSAPTPLCSAGSGRLFDIANAVELALRPMWRTRVDASVDNLIAAAGDTPEIHLKVVPVADDSGGIRHRATIEVRSTRPAVCLDLKPTHDGSVFLRSTDSNAPRNPIEWRIGHDVDILGIAACLLDRASRASTPVPCAGAGEKIVHAVRRAMFGAPPHRDRAVFRYRGGLFVPSAPWHAAIRNLVRAIAEIVGRRATVSVTRHAWRMPIRWIYVDIAGAAGDDAIIFLAISVSSFIDPREVDPELNPAHIRPGADRSFGLTDECDVLCFLAILLDQLGPDATLKIDCPFAPNREPM